MSYYIALTMYRVGLNLVSPVHQVILQLENGEGFKKTYCPKIHLNRGDQGHKLRYCPEKFDSFIHSRETKVSKRPCVANESKFLVIFHFLNSFRDLFETHVFLDTFVPVDE